MNNPELERRLDVPAPVVDRYKKVAEAVQKAIAADEATYPEFPVEKSMPVFPTADVMHYVGDTAAGFMVGSQELPDDFQIAA